MHMLATITVYFYIYISHICSTVRRFGEPVSVFATSVSKDDSSLMW
jgi:hypothetical protein